MRKNCLFFFLEIKMEINAIAIEFELICTGSSVNRRRQSSIYHITKCGATKCYITIARDVSNHVPKSQGGATGESGSETGGQAADIQAADSIEYNDINNQHECRTSQDSRSTNSDQNNGCHGQAK